MSSAIRAKLVHLIFMSATHGEWTGNTMIGWFGDGNGYVGDINLRPEVANTLSATAKWSDGARKDWEFDVTPYYTYVKTISE